MAVDVLIAGGRVYRGLQAGFAEAVLVRDGCVAAVGTLAEVEDAAPPGVRRVDLGGRVAIPAFNEAHMHLLPYGLGLRRANLRPDDGVRTLDELLRRISAAAKTTPRGDWVLGRGYDHLVLDVGRHPTAEELQQGAPDNPVYIVRTAAIWAWPARPRCALPRSGTTRRRPMAARSNGGTTG